jgi:hypothetical protein
MVANEALKRYKSVLIAFLSRRDGVAYDNDTIFPADVLSGITEEEVLRWLNYKAFGIDNPGNEDLPFHGRSSTLHFHKKAISFFIPNKHFKWNVETKTGNPTMSPGINNLIRMVKKHEVRSEGVPSRARRALTTDEFRLLIRITERQRHLFEFHIRLPTMMKFQVHLIARIDDTAHVKACDLKVHPLFDFALSVRLRWTKNCLEERDAPDQIILGAMDSDFCLIVALAVYLQYVYELTNAAQSEFLFCNTEEDPLSVKKQVSDLLMKKVMTSEDWKQHQNADNIQGTNNCGTHSLRKLAATMARLAGRGQDEVDCRGRWRDTQRISDRYTSISLPYIDANVAASLCVGGPAKYLAKEGSNVTDNWLITEFVPHIAKKLGNRVAVVLGKALLWCLMEPMMMFAIPEFLKERLRMRYLLIQTLGDDVNPIDRIALTVYHVDGTLQINPLMILFPGNADNEGREGGAAGGVVMGDTQKAILSQNHALRGRVEELFVTVKNNNDHLVQKIGTLQKAVKRFANRPVQINRGFVQKRGGENDGDANATQNDDDANETGDHVPQLYEATLSKHPRDLYMLWEEYEFGIEGRKAARKFNVRERGKNRYNYHRRKVVWDRIEEKIRQGHTYHTAIDSLYEQYGRDLSVTEIINKMRKERTERKAGWRQQTLGFFPPSTSI